ncbi:MAG: GatB/YqeY domain-containing protein [Proteobacteria bacterium]|nr:GatB/YqeY domain-containing protein [Pseudomonadota bacterium]MBI3497401.1 GatB/YqeY domain-containing protein [Pseudomonadota bacterium]
MLRKRLSEALKEAMKARAERAVSTIRMILAQLKDRDIAARPKGVSEGIGEDEINAMLQGMIKQRREAIPLFQQGGRQDLVDKEEEEIRIIEGFLPRQMDEAEIGRAVEAVVAEIGAKTVKDIGRCMALLKERYAGQMDLSKASGILRKALG